MINSKNKSTIPDTQISVAHIAHGDQCLYIHSCCFFLFFLVTFVGCIKG